MCWFQYEGFLPFLRVHCSLVGQVTKTLIFREVFEFTQKAIAPHCLQWVGSLGLLMPCVCVCVFGGHFGGQHTGYGVLQVCCVLLHSTACTSVLRVLSDWTLGAATYPSMKLAMSVRRHTKVLADGEG